MLNRVRMEMKGSGNLDIFLTVVSEMIRTTTLDNQVSIAKKLKIILNTKYIAPRLQKLVTDFEKELNTLKYCQRIKNDQC